MGTTARIDQVPSDEPPLEDGQDYYSTHFGFENARTGEKSAPSPDDHATQILDRSQFVQLFEASTHQDPDQVETILLERPTLTPSATVLPEPEEDIDVDAIGEMVEHRVEDALPPPASDKTPAPIQSAKPIDAKESAERDNLRLIGSLVARLRASKVILETRHGIPDAANVTLSGSSSSADQLRTAEYFIKELTRNVQILERHNALLAEQIAKVNHALARKAVQTEISTLQADLNAFRRLVDHDHGIIQKLLQDERLWSLLEIQAA